MGLDMFLTNDQDQEVMYWRKANSIHRWFVENVQDGVDDCGKYLVTEDHLQQLLNDVLVVLDDEDEAEEVLPTQSGFFFGSTEYDDYYFEQLKDTRDCLLKILSDKEQPYYYQSSW